MSLRRRECRLAAMARPTLNRIISAKFEVQRRFNEQLEKHLTSEFEALEEFRDQVLGDLAESADKSMEALTELFPRYLALEFIFPGILRASLLAHTYFLFEDSLHHLCKRIEARSTSGIRLEDLRGSGLLRARLFLARVAEIPFPEPDTLWEDVNNIRLLRNCIAHDYGRLRQPDSELGRFVRNHSALSLDEGSGIALSREFNPWAYDRLESFLLRVAPYAESGDRGKVST